MGVIATLFVLALVYFYNKAYAAEVAADKELTSNIKISKQK
jgi:hypothetical protein